MLQSGNIYCWEYETFPAADVTKLKLCFERNIEPDRQAVNNIFCIGVTRFLIIYSFTIGILQYGYEKLIFQCKSGTEILLCTLTDENDLIILESSNVLSCFSSLGKHTKWKIGLPLFHRNAISYLQNTSYIAI